MLYCRWNTAKIARDATKWPNRDLPPPDEDDRDIDQALGIQRGDDNDVGVSGADADASPDGSDDVEMLDEQARKAAEQAQDREDEIITEDLGARLQAGMEDI